MPPRKAKAPATRKRAAVRAALEADLAELRKRAPALADSTLAAAALAMADEIDSPINSATSKSMCAAKLLDAMESLRALTPTQEEEDEVENARKRRAERLARQSAAGSSPPS